MNSFLVSYANYINNKYDRKGGIFQKPFKRIAIEGDAHLQQAIIPDLSDLVRSADFQDHVA